MSKRPAKIVAALVDAVIAAETAKAIGLAVGGDRDNLVWIPKSQISAISYSDGLRSTDVKLDVRVRTIEMPDWLASRNGFAEDKAQGEYVDAPVQDAEDDIPF